MTHVTRINGHLFLASYLTKHEVTFVVWRYSQTSLPALDNTAFAFGAIGSPWLSFLGMNNQREDGAVMNAKESSLSAQQATWCLC